jgi:F-type H+/Na+-transporting ATPase subunit alpha
MKDFQSYLVETGEIGIVQESLSCIVIATGLPHVKPQEIVLFEDGEKGQVLTLRKDTVEILLLTKKSITVGTRITRTNTSMSVSLSLELLGKTVNSIGTIWGSSPLKKVDEVRPIEIHPPGLSERIPVEKQMETGVALVDLIVPLGKGQRELVIGDRKTGKTEFLYQTMISQSQRGVISIYAVIGQKQVETLLLDQFLREKNIRESTLIVSSSSSDAPGIIYLTPYVAMTIAEYFRDQGKDVLLILDDMTTHARAYREISLLAKRLPGRGSYPGDIFYAHARLVERAGAFIKGSITCLPVAESVLGDLSGYIQTNLMSMTDGHIFFDIELYNQGNRPAINPFLSVTRVGHQTQGKLERELSNSVSSFLVVYDRMKQFMHFGTEASESARNILAQGTRLDVFLNQGTELIFDLPLSIFIIGCIWSGKINDLSPNDFKKKISLLYTQYKGNPEFKSKIDTVVHAASFTDLVTILKRDADIYLQQI